MSEPICNNCGSKLKDSQKFCNHCGTAITKQEKSIIKETRIRKQPTVIQLIAIVLCFVGISAAISYGIMISDGTQTSYDNSSSYNSTKAFSNEYYSFEYPASAYISNNSNSWITSVNDNSGNTIVEIWVSDSEQSLEYETQDLISTIKSGEGNKANLPSKLTVDGLEANRVIATYPTLGSKDFILVKHDGKLYEIVFGKTLDKDMILKSFKFK